MREHPPVPISELDVHIRKLRSNNNNSFTREYEVWLYYLQLLFITT